MSIVIIIFSILAGTVGLILVAALFIKKEYSIKRTIVVGKPVAEVFDYVRYLRNQDYFSKWVMADPEMKKVFSGQDGTVGFVYAWDGNQKAGKGEQEITDIQDGSLIDIEVRFEKPFRSTARTPIAMEPIAQNETRVTWGMEGSSKYPFNFMNLVMAGVLGKDLESSLRNLKNNVEKKDSVNL